MMSPANVSTRNNDLGLARATNPPRDDNRTCFAVDLLVNIGVRRPYVLVDIAPGPRPWFTLARRASLQATYRSRRATRPE